MDAACFKVRTRQDCANRALGETSEESHPDSDGPELRCDVYPDGDHGYSTRGDFLAR